MRTRRSPRNQDILFRALGREQEPRTFREPDVLPEPVPAPIFCARPWCGAVIHDGDGVGCESCGDVVHRETCALPLDEKDGTWVCHGCAVLVAMGSR